MPDLKVLLISTYELGRQPFGLASPAAWLRADGFQTTSLDLSRQSLDEEAVRTASLIAFYLPMHTATRIAVRALERVRKLNPSAHLCGFGLYAPVNAGLLRRLGVGTILGGEFEQGLLSLVRRLEAVAPGPGLPQVEPEISLARQNFLVPYRDDLPPLEKYANLTLPDDSTRVVGYTEASRGCKHLCRHCPIVPIYNSSGVSARITPRLPESASGLSTQGKVISPEAMSWSGFECKGDLLKAGTFSPASRNRSRERYLSRQMSVASGGCPRKPSLWQARAPVEVGRSPMETIA